MSKFVQLHYLTVYPPSNPNRDDLGRPKTAVFGGSQRLRISSQSIKRAARLSPIMSDTLRGNLGLRTQRLGEEIVDYLTNQGAEEKRAHAIAKSVAKIFGGVDGDSVRIKQLAFISPDERKAALDLSLTCFRDNLPPDQVKSEQVLRKADGAVDIAMFGRMLAESPEFNREAAVQVSHAFTTHQAITEDDFYTAADDLKQSSEDMGAGFVGEAGFGSGVYYLYVCVDLELLINNLSGDHSLARLALLATLEAFATSSPSGKRNSFGHHTRASFIRAETGTQQPRSLAAAFLNPVRGSDLLENSVIRLRDTASAIDDAYGATADQSIEMYVVDGTGSMEDVKTFVAGQVPHA